MTATENPVVDEAVEAGWRTLLFRAGRPSPAEQGVSALALQRMTMSVEALAEVANPALDPSARRVLRYLACLVPYWVEDKRLPDIVTQVADHPHLPLEAVREILYGEGEGEGREVSATSLRAVADLLREGQGTRLSANTWTLDDISELCDVSLDIVKNVSAFLGIVEARTERLQDAAAEFVEDGRSAREFADEQGVGYTYARELLQAARAVGDIPL